MRFLIVKPSSLGDILHAAPAVSALLKAFPGSSADWVIFPAFADLTAYVPGVEENILFERKKLGKILSFPRAFVSLFRNIRRKQYDAVIDLQGLARSAFTGLLASGRHAGPDAPREKIATMCYGTKMHVPPHCHAVKRNNAMIADFLKRDDLDFSYAMPRIPRFEEEADALLSAVPGNGVFCAVAPGARWQTKEWPPEFFAKVITGLHAKHPDLRFLLLGTKDECARAARIRQMIPEDCIAADLCGKTSLGGLVEVIRRTELFICNDSGPMHIAAALDVPVLALFGPTDPVLTGPYSQRSVVLQPECSCILCMKRNCDTMKCHSSVSADSAIEKAHELLTKYSNHINLTEK